MHKWKKDGSSYFPLTNGRLGLHCIGLSSSGLAKNWEKFVGFVAGSWKNMEMLTHWLNLWVQVGKSNGVSALSRPAFQ